MVIGKHHKCNGALVMHLRAVPEIILRAGGGPQALLVLWGEGVLLTCPRGGG